MHSLFNLSTEQYNRVLHDLSYLRAIRAVFLHVAISRKVVVFLHVAILRKVVVFLHVAISRKVVVFLHVEILRKSCSLCMLYSLWRQFML